jgi:ABC-2 type transport system permease protein
VATLPAWMQGIAHVLPPSYVFEGMRAIVAGAEFSGASLFAGAALALLYIGLAYAFFTRVHRHAVRTGLIARYAAETVN